MTLGHFLYIPGMLLLGAVVGYIVGSRAAETARADEQERDRRKAARDARRRASQDADRADS